MNNKNIGNRGVFNDDVTMTNTRMNGGSFE